MAFTSTIDLVASVADLNYHSDTLSREELSKKINSDIQYLKSCMSPDADPQEAIDSSEALNFFLMADRLEQIAAEYKNQLKELAVAAFEDNYLSEDKKTCYVGEDQVTYTETKVYEYPQDKTIDMYREKLDKVNTQLKPLASEAKGLEASIKARQKQLEEKLKPVRVEATLRVAKK